MDYGAFIVWFLLAAAVVICGVFVTLSVLLKRDRDHVYKKGLGILVLLFLLWTAHVYKTFFLDEALISASYRGDVVRVQTLLRRGADPEASFNGTTPLQAARSNAHQDVVDILIKAGAKQ